MSITMGQLASRFLAASREVKPESSKQLKTLAQAGVGLMKKEIQSMHAVDTGTMLNSTTAEMVGPTTCLIGPTVDYAAFVALGTSRVVARPFHIEAAKKLGRIAKSEFDLDLGV